MNAQQSLKYFVLVAGRCFGPYVRDEMLGMLATGEMPPDVRVWREDKASWLPLGCFPEVSALSAGFARATGRNLNNHGGTARGPYDSRGAPQPLALAPAPSRSAVHRIAELALWLVLVTSSGLVTGYALNRIAKPSYFSLGRPRITQIATPQGLPTPQRRMAQNDLTPAHPRAAHPASF